jgi:hypothetical protein
MKLKYVGLKEEETAFSPETGITWTPGSSHEVPDAIAKRMLAHPDVFALDAAKPAPVKAATQAPPPPPPPAPPPPAPPAPPASIVKGEFVIAAPDGPLVLDGMDRETLLALAKESGLKPHPNTGVEKLQLMLVGAFPVKAE